MEKGILFRMIQLVKFSFVGGINTLISLIIYYGLIYFDFGFMTATVIGYLGSSVVGYIMNRFWVFKVKETELLNSVIKYYVVYGSSLLINMGCMYLWVDTIGISKMIAPLLTLCITVPYNFILSKLWIFNQKNKEELL